MPTFDLGTLGGVLANLGVSILTYAGIAAILYNIGKILIRTVSWTLDNMLISLIGKFYGYFEEILGGTIFTDSIVKGMMNRVYLIIGVFILFRLGMLLIQYIMNPAEVMEEKGGVNSLVKRAIVGLCLIIFIPTIFGIANDLQAAILKDQVIEKIIMDETTLDSIAKQKAKYGTGQIIGMTIFQGFWNIDKNQVTDKNMIKAYEDAEEKMDPNLIEEAGYGILSESGGKYAYDYFPILSTAVLGYVLYLVIKYCIDMVVRLFKLLILQIIAPITIVEYIVNGDRNEVFQKWKKSVVANYAMLFVRVFTIWFVTYVAWLMRTGVGGKSLLDTQDYLLKAIIVLGLLAFMMDFPKMMSDIFGLDLEQDASVKGVLGKAMGVGMAGLAIGGAAAGFGLRAAHGVSGATKTGLANFAQNKGKNNFAAGMRNPVKSSAKLLGAASGNAIAGMKALAHTYTSGGSIKGNYRNVKSYMDTKATNAKSKVDKIKTGNLGQLGSSIAEAAGKEHLGKKMLAGAAVVGATVAKSNKVTGAAYSSFDETGKSMKEVDKKAEARALESEERAYRQHQIEVTDQINATTTVVAGEQQRANIKLDNIVDNTERTVTQTVNIDQKLGNISGDISNIAQNTETTATQTVNIDQKLGKVSGNIENIAQNTETTATQIVNMDQKLGKISGDVSNIADNTEITADVALNVEPLVGSMDESLKDINTNTEISADVDLNVEPIINDIGQNVNRINNDQNNADTNSNNS